MGARLQALCDLQEIELQLADIRRQLRRKERMVSAQGEKAKASLAALEAEREELKRIQANVDELDLDIKARSGKITRLREYLNTVKTNKEYAAVLAELNNEKADVTRLETRALAMMEQIETKTKVFREHEELQRHELERLEQLKAEWQQADQALSGRRDELERQRTEAAAKLERDILSLFDRVSQRYDGEVMAKVVRTRPGRDEFVCEGCYMSLNAERFNALTIRDEVLTCANCSRILYIEPNHSAAN